MRSDSYPEDGKNRDDYLSEVTENVQPFHIGQCYEAFNAVQLKCKKCASTEFHLARGNYYATARCIYCLWEVCVHSG